MIQIRQISSIFIKIGFIWLILIFIPVNLYAVEFYGQANAGFGYVSNPYLNHHSDVLKNEAEDLGLQVTNKTSQAKVKGNSLFGVDNSGLCFGLAIDFKLYYRELGFGISSGLLKSFSNSILFFKNNTVKDAEANISSYILPQSLNVFYIISLHENNNLTFSIGPTYYYSKTKWSIDNKSGSYEYTEDGNEINNDFGLNCMIELSYMITDNIFFDFGIKGHCLFTDYKTGGAGQIYFAITEKASDKLYRNFR